ncbi:Uncharacterised protein [Bordetella pertussis]|nr:Uncharacterised protein [Bordetella pertussis]
MPMARSFAPTCGCAPMATPDRWPGAWTRWSTISSARGASGSATPGSRPG